MSQAAVKAVLQSYFDGLYHSDAEALRQVFHPKAHYVCATDEDLVHMDMAAYLPIVAARPSPASRSDARADRIVSIDFAGPHTARALVECTLAPKAFSDFLTLVFTGGRWQIISKVFHYQIRSS
ncbi:hypothetical protein ABI_06290 [Asticcacaulis biprosthecium C19]|uniref:Lumazine-binding family protein n=1 Tax=Asticcacaulis biprosthecium C19 TaxID=715226 RepID=F4QKX3_9CAUL|nr:nuclear transport factor 2 family protein [Asticcacaulis biprosthecium]EGF92196.1 hypothetical protein ABI_06290 [Asticcacaulis biprosthecium C19]